MTLIPGSTTATFSSACRRCSPAPVRKSFSPCSHTAGAPPDCLSTTLCLVRPPGPTYVFRQTLTVELNTLARLADALGYDVVVNFNKRP